MKIGIDISALGERNYTGIGVYVSNLVRNLARIDADSGYYLCYRLSRLKYRRLKNPVRQSNFRFKIIQEPLNYFFQRKLDVFHGPAERLPDFRRPYKIVTIHDLSITRKDDFHAENFKRLMMDRYDKLIRRKQADAIITVSENSKKEICSHYQIDPERIHVVHHGVDEVFKKMPETSLNNALERLNKGKPYIFYAGALQERKNTVRLVKAFAKFAKQMDNFELVLAGKPTWKFENIQKTIIESGLEHKVRIMGYVSKPDLIALYSGASMFAFPSLYEGFGLPILEAMACGCPVVTSCTTSMPEVAGDAAILVDPLSVDDITAGMMRLMDKSEREIFIKKGYERAKKFTWQNTARRTLDVYRRFL